MHRSSIIPAALVLVSLAVCGAARAQGTAAPAFSADLNRAAVVKAMTAAADWQLANPSSHAPYDWTQAAFYTGVMALDGVAGTPKYADAMRAMGEKNQWRPGLRPGHADDYAVVATYAQLYVKDKDKKQLAPGLALFDYLAMRKYDEPLAWGNHIESRELAWCDALFMGPPAMSAVFAATGRPQVPRSRQQALVEDHRLPVRQGRAALLPRQPVLRASARRTGRRCSGAAATAGCSRVSPACIQDMPEDYPDRARYVALFRDMTETVAAVQGKDGYWRSSLLDPDSRPNPETSGTGFFVYGLAWGINKGILPRATYEPHVVRGWKAMVSAVHPNGMLGWVQRIGDQPGATTADTTEVYGVGALLLAGSEVYRMSPAR